jgi:hypothetical protein
MPEDEDELSFNSKDLRLEDIDAVWRGVNVDMVGRFLRAHLVIEHFINEHLQKINPSLGDVQAARLTFKQKTDLLNPNSAFIKWVLPGILKLNAIRNKFAHRPNYQLIDQDVRDLFGPGITVAKFMRGPDGDGPTTYTPIDVVEAFAQFAAEALRLDTTIADKFNKHLAVARKEQYEKLKRLAALAGEPIEESD